MGRRTDRQEQAVRVRPLREAERRASADDLPVESRRRAGRRQHDPRQPVRSRRAQPVPVGELQLRNRPVRRRSEEHARQTVDAQGRLQHQQRQQGHLPVQPARLEQRRAAVRLVVARHEPADQQHAVPDLRQLELPDPGKPQVGRRRVELGVRQHDEQPAHRLHQTGREPRSDPAVPVRHHRRRRRQPDHVVRIRAVHAVQPALLQHAAGAGQRDDVQEEPLDYIRRQRREVPLGQLVLLRHPERLLVQHPERLLRRREQLPRQPEPHGFAGPAEHLPGEVPAAARADAAAAPAARRDLQRRVHSGRMAAAGEPDGDGRSPCRRAALRQHGVPEPGGRCTDVPRSGWRAGPLQHRRPPGNDRGTGRRASA